MKETVSITPENQGKRLDLFLTQLLPDLSRTHIQRLIEEKVILVNHLNTKANYKLRLNDTVTWNIPAPEPLQVKPEPIPLAIIYEDDDLLVVNKPQGMVVHPANGNYQGTLVNALLYHCRGNLSGINGILRPGIVHRIDKDTSGLLLVAKNDLAHRSLAQQIKDHTVKRAYLALVHGVMSEPGGIIDAPIGRDLRDRQKMAVVLKNSKNALTEYRTLARYSEYTLVKCFLKTGRTHQIRVHMGYINHPVVGDRKYGPQKPHLGFSGQALHAQTIGFTHPRSQEELEFHVDPPEEFLRVLHQLGSKVNLSEEGEAFDKTRESTDS